MGTSNHNMLRPLLVLGTLSSPALADPAVGSDAWPVVATRTLVVDGGLLAGHPVALPTGLSRGLGAGATVGHGWFRFGGRVGWVTATESTLSFEVTHRDLQVRALAGIEQVAGRGRIGLRLGAGGTLVHESRRRAQGDRAGLMGDDLATTALALVPAGDIEVTVGLAIFGAWSVALAGGPSLAVIDGELGTSWIAQLGVGWQR